MSLGEIPSPEDSERQFTFRKRKNTICLDMSGVSGVRQASIVSLIKDDLKIDLDLISDIQLHPVRKFVFLKLHADIVDEVETVVSNGVFWTENRKTVFGWKCGSNLVHLRLFGVSPDKSVEEVENVLSQFCVVKGMTRGKLHGLPNVSDGTIHAKVDLSGSLAALPPYIVFREEGEIWKITSRQVIDCCWKCSKPGHIGRFCPEQPSWAKRVRKRKHRAGTKNVQPEKSSGDDGKTTEVKKPSGNLSDLEDGEVRSDDEDTEIDDKEAVSVSDDEDNETGVKKAVSVPKIDEKEADGEVRSKDDNAKISEKEATKDDSPEIVSEVEDSVMESKNDWSEEVDDNDKKRKSDTNLSNEGKKPARINMERCWICDEEQNGIWGRPCRHCNDCRHEDYDECENSRRLSKIFHKKREEHLNECSKQYQRCPHCWKCFKLGHRTDNCQDDAQTYTEFVASRYKLYYCWVCKDYYERNAGDAHIKFPDMPPQDPCNHCFECNHDDLLECKNAKGIMRHVVDHVTSR